MQIKSLYISSDILQNYISFGIIRLYDTFKQIKHIFVNTLDTGEMRFSWVTRQSSHQSQKVSHNTSA